MTDNNIEKSIDHSSDKAGSNPMTNGNSTRQNRTKEPSVTEGKQPEPSNAEKKKLAKAEKAAKRAQEKGLVQADNVTAKVPSTASDACPVSAQEQSLASPRSTASRQNQPEQRASRQENRPRRGSAGAAVGAALPLRRRLSQSTVVEQVKQSKSKTEKQVGFFAHLYNQPRRHTLEGSSKEVHPAIQALSLQLSHYVICGSHARCVAMLLALRSVIQSYTTPLGTSLPRHLSSHALSPQLSHIKSHGRPFSTSQSNAIRWLKNLIANIDPSTPEPTAKASLHTAINNFIRERFTVADAVIADAVAKAWVRDGDVVMCYGKSAVVEKTLLEAHRQGRRFRVLSVDGRPLFEGKNLARKLAAEGIEVSYCLTSGLAQAAIGATKCILGAHAVLANGRLYSRVGTALVAMVAKAQGVPVVVCAETVKFTERVALDSVVVNELAPEDELVFPYHDDDDVARGGTLRDWREKDNLNLLNILYDVTPAEMIDVIVTELGSLPPGSAPVVQRMSAGVESTGS